MLLFSLALHCVMHCPRFSEAFNVSKGLFGVTLACRIHFDRVKTYTVTPVMVYTKIYGQ